MTGAPARRGWLYTPTDSDDLEIWLFGALEDIGWMFAAVKSAAERWPGFERVTVFPGNSAGGMRVSLTRMATYNDPIAEALLMFRSSDVLRVIRWATPDGHAGSVGGW